MKILFTAKAKTAFSVMMIQNSVFAENFTRLIILPQKHITSYQKKKRILDTIGD